MQNWVRLLRAVKGQVKTAKFPDGQGKTDVLFTLDNICSGLEHEIDECEALYARMAKIDD
jgi:hypothetical protein